MPPKSERDPNLEETTDINAHEEEPCTEHHVADLDEQSKLMLSTFSTICSRLKDVERAESDIKRFELSIEADRKRLQKTLETAKTGLKNARVQMAVELAKADGAGFQKIVDTVKGAAGV